MIVQHRLEFPEAQFLCASLLEWGNRVKDAWEAAEPGSPERERASHALRGVGWLCCHVEAELRARPDDFHVGEGIADEVQRFLKSEGG